MRTGWTSSLTVGDFWLIYGLDAPDGRRLHAYALTDDCFARLANDVRSRARTGRLAHEAGPGLFVLWAAEWFRRCYQGGVRRWQSVVDALDVGTIEQGFLREITEQGLELWRRELQVAASGRRFFYTLAREGGFPLAALGDGVRGWAPDMMHAIVAPLLAERDASFDTAHALARAQAHRPPLAFRDEEFLTLCADLALEVVRLRRLAEDAATAAGIPVAAWLDLHRPGWRNDLPITVDKAAASLIDALMQVEPVMITRGKLSAERLIERTADGWREAMRLNLDGEIGGEAMQGIDPREGRLRAYASGTLARALPGELAMIEPPASGETLWTARPSGASQGVRAVPFDAPSTLDLRAGDRRVGSIRLRDRGGQSGNLVVCSILEGDAEAPQLLKVEGHGSGGFVAQTLVVQVPVDWRVETEGVEPAARLGPGVGHTELWRASGIVWVTSAEGDRYRLRAGESSDRRDRIELVGRSPSWAQTAPQVELFCGPPIVHCEGPPGGSLFIREIGAREWRQAPARLPMGHYDLGWRQDGVLRYRKRTAILPESARLDVGGRGTSARYSLTGLGPCRLIPSAEAPVVAENDCLWHARPVPAPAHLFNAEIDWPPAEHCPPLPVSLRFPADPTICRWDGIGPRPGERLTLGDLRDLVVLDSDTTTLIGELVVNHRVIETMRWVVHQEMPLSAAAQDIASLLWPMNIDAEVRLSLTGTDSTWRVRQFQQPLQLKGRRAMAPAEASLAGEVRARAFADPTRERVIGPVDADRTAEIPDDLAGLCLVYLRRETEILTRPAYFRGSRALPPRDRIGRAMLLSPGQGLEEALTGLLLAGEEESPDASALIAEFNAFAASLGGLPAMTFKLLESAAEHPIVLARMAMLATDLFRPAILALSDALPFAWCLVPEIAWQDAMRCRWDQAMAMFAPLGDGAARYARQMVDDAVARLIVGEPLLRAVLQPGGATAEIEAIAQAFLNRAHHLLPETSTTIFRDRLGDRLPAYFERFDARFLDALDAPCAAALAVRGAWSPAPTEVRRIKTIARSFPAYFADAFASCMELP